MVTFLLFQILLLVGLPYWLWRYQPAFLYTRACYLAFLMKPWCRLTGCRLLIEVNGTTDDEASARGHSRLVVSLLRLQERWNLRAADTVICVTSGLRQIMIERGADENRTYVLHNGSFVDIVPCLDQRQARVQLGLNVEAYLIGFAGTFAPWQGLDCLLDAVKHLANQPLDRPVQCALMGQGQCEGKIRRKIQAENLGPYVTLLPPDRMERAAIFHDACDVIVIPVTDPAKLRHGLSPLKFWDALSRGVPVLVPSEAELGEFLDEVGLPGVFTGGDAQDLAARLAEVLPQTLTYQKRRKEIISHVARYHSWQARAERLIGILCLH